MGDDSKNSNEFIIENTTKDNQMSLFIQEVLIGNSILSVNDIIYEIKGPIDSKVRLEYLFCTGEMFLPNYESNEMNKITLKQIENLISLPLNELIFKAQKVHKENFENGDVQLASLISIKTGSCPEDYKYCPQSAHYNVNLKKRKIL